MKNNYYFLYTDILDNIKRAYTSVKSDHKNFILSLVAYNNNKQFLKDMGYKFTSSQFKKAIEKRVSKDFNLKGYLRNVPKSMKKLNELEISTIKDYLDCGAVKQGSSGRINILTLKVFKLTDIFEKILPFFNKYKVLGVNPKILIIDVKL